ncbi:MAG: hypothetical protein K2I44_04270, partial [Muribaculaceae bacterium]|nr:hypothetical protein [Muribaculaceae bacterium]
ERASMLVCMAALSFLFYNPEAIMKKISIGVFLSLIVLSSCSTMKKSATLSDIEGEWTIVNINGQPLQVADSGQLPFIGFDTHNGKIYGNIGKFFRFRQNIHAAPFVIS